MVDDETLFRTMEVAAETGALVMVHAENGDVIDVLVKQALEAGHTEPLYHALTRPPEAEGEATNRAIQLAHLAGSPLYVVHVSCKRGGRADRSSRARRAGTSGARPARSTSSVDSTTSRSRTSKARSTSTRRRCGQVEPGRALERRAKRRPVGDLDRPLRVPLRRSEDARQGRLLEDPERRPGPREPAADDPRVRRSRRAGSASTAWSSCSRRTRRSSSASIRERARSRSAPTPTSSSSTRRRRSRSPRRRTTRRSDYNLYEGTKVTGSPDVVLLRGHVLVESDELVA